MDQIINHCSLASKDPELEQKYLYAYNVRYRLKHNLATQYDIKQELRKRKDHQEIMRILEELKNVSN